MPNWKKVIVSGSNATLNNITASGHMSVLEGSLTVNTHTSTELEVVGDISASGGTVTGNNIVAANNISGSNELEVKYRKLNLTTSTAGDYNGDVVFFGNSGGAPLGSLIYYDITSGNWDAADRGGGEIMGKSLLGIALADGVLVRGIVTTNQFVNTDTGVNPPLYIGATGVIYTTPPTVNGDISRIIGHTLTTATSSPFKIYFNPSPDWIEIEA